MKNAFSIFTFLTAWLTGYSQWQPSNGPEGESLKKIIYANGRLIAIPSGAGSLYEYNYSDTYGDVWQKDTFTLSSNPLDLIAAGDYFVTRTNDGVFFSENKGDTWEKRHTGLPADVKVGSLSGSGNMVFIADGFTKKSYKSSDFGENWTEMGSTGIESGEHIKTVNIAGNGDYLGSSSKSLYYSEDNGDTWTESSGLPAFANIKQVVSTSTHCVIITTTFHLYVSGDNGRNWSKPNSEQVYINSLTAADDTVYAAMREEEGEGIAIIPSNGERNDFITRNTGLLSYQASSLVQGNNFFFVSSRVGVYRSSDKGNQWTLSNKGLGYLGTYGFSSIGDTLFAATEVGVWRSRSYGLRWVPVGPDHKLFDDVLAVGDMVYAINSAGVYESDDIGETWTALGSGFPADISKLKLGNVNNALYFFSRQGADKGLYKLTDFSGTWQQVSVSPSNEGGMSIVGDTIYVSNKYSTNYGDSWNSISGTNNQAEVFIKTSGHTYAGAYPQGRKPAYRSADGISFTGFDDGLPAECAGVYHIVQKDDTVFTAVVAESLLEKPLVYYTTGALSEWKLYDHTGIGDVLSDFQNNMKIFAASHSFFLSAPTDEAGFYRYDFAMLPEVSDTIDDYEYPPLETVDVSLKSLTVDNGNLSPTFAPNQLNYTVSLSGGTVTVPTVSAEANDAGADADVVQATNLTGTKAQRTATITVTGSDDTTTRTYTVEFSIALSSDATLSSLNPGQGTLTPAFSSSTLVYTVELPAGTTDVPTASATANDAGASVDITQATNLTGTQAERTAAIEVTAEDGISTNTYQIVYSVAPEPGKDANLASLTLDNGTLEPAFAAGIENYTATLPQGTTDVPVVSAETSDANAAKTINQATSLKGTETERTATVEVTSEDSTVTKTYSVVFSVESGTFINNTGETGIKTYPNPVSDMLTIHSSGMIQSVSIYDLGGKAVKQTAVAGNTATIDVSGLDAGMYLVGVRETSGKMIMNKIIKQ